MQGLFMPGVIKISCSEYEVGVNVHFFTIKKMLNRWNPIILLKIRKNAVIIPERWIIFRQSAG